VGGVNFRLDNDMQILSLSSPRRSVGGPYAVVYKNLNERWAIVALDWDAEPRLGIRWFWGSGGNPFSSSYPTWLVIPPSLSKGVLASLPLPHTFHRMLDDFLAGVITGDELRRKNSPPGSTGSAV
jgi:hypothetical protein